MQTLLTSAQMRDADLFTLKEQNIRPIKLIEIAAKAFVKVFSAEFHQTDLRIAIFCGQGNNGADGLAIARLLAQKNYSNIAVYIADFSTKQSGDFNVNLARLRKTKIPINYLSVVKELETLKCELIIDGILGAGLNRPLQGSYLALAKAINKHLAKVVAIDIPTGLNGENEIPEKYEGVKADLVISFHLPKINFFFPESAVAMERFKVVDIGLNNNFIEKQNSFWKLTTETDLIALFKKRKNFSHKGTYGHALIVAGSDTTMGAALLAASACLHCGAGLTTLSLPQSGLTALNIHAPEVMYLPRSTPIDKIKFTNYDAFAIGPGLGLEEINKKWLAALIAQHQPLVIDADALNILSKNPDLLSRLAPKTILTPHIKEFERLFGKHKNWWTSVQTARKKAIALKIIIVLKNQYTFVCLPTGEIFINPTGNPAMASGGMGDVLTGILTALLAQAYTPTQAAILGVYLHGKAGDELSQERFTVSASQLTLQIPKTMKICLASLM